MKNELNIVIDAVKRAGACAMQFAKDGFEIYRKTDHSPVTSADLAINDILKETLMSHFPEDAWMSEESPDSLARLNTSRVWVIDPIDGTSYFIKGIPQFSISVALVEQQQPILGVVYNPAKDELFSALRGKGLYLNGKPLHVNPTTNDPLTILVNPSRLDRKEFQAYQTYARLQPMGSIAYSLALVAAGQADGTINFDRLHEWDVAAGCLLIQESGGTNIDSNGAPIHYNQVDPIIHGILATHLGSQEAFKELLSHTPIAP